MSVITGQQYSTQFQVLVDGVLTDGANTTATVQVNGVDYPMTPAPTVLPITTGHYLVTFDGYTDWLLNDRIDVTLFIDVIYNGVVNPVSEQKLVGLYGSIPVYDATAAIIIDDAFGPVSLTSADLVVGENTVLSLETAQYIATINPKLSSWNTMTLQERVGGLLAIQPMLNRLCFRVDGIEFEDEDGCPTEHIKLGNLTADDLALLPADMMAALGAAAVGAALSAAECDNADMERADGIMQARSGEESHMYRPGVPMRYPLPTDVMWSLSPWLCNHGPMIGRNS